MSLSYPSYLLCVCFVLSLRRSVILRIFHVRSLTCSCSVVIDWKNWFGKCMVADISTHSLVLF